MNVKNQQLKIKKRLLGLVICANLIFVNFLSAQDCKYNKNGLREINDGHMVLQQDAGKVRKIRGKVLNTGVEELANVQIVLYRIEFGKRIYIGSQSSGTNGGFCFKGMKKGKYEMQIGGLQGFDKTIVYLQLEPKNRTLPDKFDATLNVGY